MLRSTSTTLEYRAAGLVTNSSAFSRRHDCENPDPREEVPTDHSAVTGRYVPAEGIERVFSPYFAKLKAIAVDKSLVPVGAEIPSETSLKWAATILQHLRDVSFPPTKVTASAEGGVAICFIQGDAYSDFECLNTGEILGVTSNRKDRPSVWEVECSARGICTGGCSDSPQILPTTNVLNGCFGAA